MKTHTAILSVLGVLFLAQAVANADCSWIAWRRAFRGELSAAWRTEAAFQDAEDCQEFLTNMKDDSQRRGMVGTLMTLTQGRSDNQEVSHWLSLSDKNKTFWFGCLPMGIMPDMVWKR
ncbi:MAG TPA: hypothetical protein VGL11_15990 [Candidatus Binatia bacterium]